MPSFPPPIPAEHRRALPSLPKGCREPMQQQHRRADARRREVRSLGVSPKRIRRAMGNQVGARPSSAGRVTYPRRSTTRGRVAIEETARSHMPCPASDRLRSSSGTPSCSTVITAESFGVLMDRPESCPRPEQNCIQVANTSWTSICLQVALPVSTMQQPRQGQSLLDPRSKHDGRQPATPKDTALSAVGGMLSTTR